MKRFPRETCFAFSGIFFLLTILVMFQSENPFGFAAVVAYISSLTLTIILFSAPYFASYFINYYRKLHQIEEAILLLSEKEELRKSPAQILDETSGIREYSAVSVIENSSPTEDHASSSSEEDTSASEVNPLTEATDLKPEADAAERSDKKRNNRVTRRESAIDSMQLSLFEMQTADVETDESESEDAEHSDTDDSENEATEPTTIHAFALLDGKVDLFVRGSPPLSEEKGEKMRRIDVGKYEYVVETLTDPLELTLWINDKKPLTNTPVKIEPGRLNECYPEF